MRVGIHQINFFPWFGYFNKMAKSDVFVYLDKVQLSVRGPSLRTYLLENEQKQHVSVGAVMKGHRDKSFDEILLNPNSPWKKTLNQFLQKNYSTCPFYNEISAMIDDVINIQSDYLIDINMASVEMIKDALEIETKTILQSQIQVDDQAKKSELMMHLTKVSGGDIYLSGNGARKYMDLQIFDINSIKVQYQTFKPFEYYQNSENFVPGLSVLDAFFYIGIEKTKQLFWENIQNDEVTEEVNY